MRVFNTNFDDLNMKEVLEKIEQFLKLNKQHYIVLPYSEFIVRAQKNEGFKEILNNADLCLCEGRGLWLMAKLTGKKLKQNIYGVDLIYELLNTKYKLRAFLLGGTQEVIKRTVERLGESIIGWEHGYQDLDKVIDKINKIKPDVLLVGLGSPKQEKWIYNNLKKMPSVKVAIGVGGAFDFISGHIKRAPKFLQKAGFEWLWRLILQPRRTGRISRGVAGLTWLTFKNVLVLKSRPFNSRKR